MSVSRRWSDRRDTYTNLTLRQNHDTSDVTVPKNGAGITFFGCPDTGTSITPVLICRFSPMAKIVRRMDSHLIWISDLVPV